MAKESMFGCGLTYCIGLFLAHAAHAEKFKKEVKIIPASIKKIMNWPEMWFYFASDHLYDLDTSVISNKRFRKEINKWAAKVIDWGHGFKHDATEEDVEWSLEKAKEFLRRIDKNLLGVKVIKGQWE